jgi:hypothetical protein
MSLSKSTGRHYGVSISTKPKPWDLFLEPLPRSRMTPFKVRSGLPFQASTRGPVLTSTVRNNVKHNELYPALIGWLLTQCLQVLSETKF